uniref:Transposase n=1 Tax=Heterorhabditis bacteriophora TaxID=37862 RepID=A0A1I7X0Z0_HETBA
MLMIYAHKVRIFQDMSTNGDLTYRRNKIALETQYLQKILLYV